MTGAAVATGNYASRMLLIPVAYTIHDMRAQTASTLYDSHRLLYIVEQ